MPKYMQMKNFEATNIEQYKVLYHRIIGHQISIRSVKPDA